MVAKWQAIKPGAYKNKAMLKALRMEMKTWGEEKAIPAFEKVPAGGWQGEQPYWIQIYRAGETWIENLIQPQEPESLSALKWLWLDKGTKPHPIAVKDPTKFLVFAPEYSAGSSPGSLITVPAKSSGGIRKEKEVMHPGIEPRGWTDILVEQLTQSYQESAQIGFEEAARASGHGEE